MWQGFAVIRRFEKINCRTAAGAISGWNHVAVDAHVHMHHGEASLVMAAHNIARACPNAEVGALMLVEREGEDVFSSLRDNAPEGIFPTDEAIALLYDAQTVPLLIIAGRQVVTAEGVELLLLGTLERPRDRTPLDVLLAEHAPQTIAVLPWGFGKWIGRRGSVVRAALMRQARLVAGDIQARPSMLLSPTLRRSSRLGMPVLVGTDPLPMGSDWERIGGFGQVLRTPIDPATPATSVLNALLEPGNRLYGERKSLTDAVRQQWAWHCRQGRAA